MVPGMAEHRARGADHPDIVKACAQAFDTLREEALPPRASLDLIAEVRNTWT